MKKNEIIQQKLFDKDSLERKIHLWRFRDQRIVFTNGCFDLLHKGHLHVLTQAADQGDVLIVGMNSDASIQTMKGPARPVLNQQTRAKILASLFYVDAVIVFNEPTPIDLIKMIVPDVLVKGGDYTLDQVVGADWVLENKGDVKIADYLPGYSTTEIEQKIAVNPK